MTHEEEGCVQVLAVSPHIISVEIFGFPAVDGVKVGACIVRSQRIKEFVKQRAEADVGVISGVSIVGRDGRTSLDRAGRLVGTPAAEPSLVMIRACRQYLVG